MAVYTLPVLTGAYWAAFAFVPGLRRGRVMRLGFALLIAAIAVWLLDFASHADRF